MHAWSAEAIYAAFSKIRGAADKVIGTESGSPGTAWTESLSFSKSVELHDSHRVY
ncbi:hypothetical protein ACLK19_13845 [Escherichia coli]